MCVVNGKFCIYCFLFFFFFGKLLISAVFFICRNLIRVCVIVSLDPVTSYLTESCIVCDALDENMFVVRGYRNLVHWIHSTEVDSLKKPLNCVAFGTKFLFYFLELDILHRNMHITRPIYCTTTDYRLSYLDVSIAIN